MKIIQFLMNIHYIFANIHSKKQKKPPIGDFKTEICKKETTLDCKHQAFFIGSQGSSL